MDARLHQVEPVVGLARVVQLGEPAAAQLPQDAGLVLEAQPSGRVHHLCIDRLEDYLFTCPDVLRHQGVDAVAALEHASQPVATREQVAAVRSYNRLVHRSPGVPPRTS